VIVGKAWGAGGATTWCWPARRTCRWERIPTSGATPGAGSSARSRTRCGGWAPTGPCRRSWRLSGQRATAAERFTSEQPTCSILTRGIEADVEPVRCAAGAGLRRGGVWRSHTARCGACRRPRAAVGWPDHAAVASSPTHRITSSWSPRAPGWLRRGAPAPPSHGQTAGVLLRQRHGHMGYRRVIGTAGLPVQAARMPTMHASHHTGMPSSGCTRGSRSPMPPTSATG
jgi:hypothetical protein